MSSIDFGTIFKKQKTFQKGYGYSHKPFTRPIYRPTFQRGRGGLGNIFSHLYRYIKPWVKSGIDSVKKELISSGIDILSDQSGAPLKEIVGNRGKTAIKNLKRKAQEKLDNIMKGSGKFSSKKKRKLENGPLVGIRTSEFSNLMSNKKGKIQLKKRKKPRKKSTRSIISKNKKSRKKRTKRNKKTKAGTNVDDIFA